MGRALSPEEAAFVADARRGIDLGEIPGIAAAFLVPAIAAGPVGPQRGDLAFGPTHIESRGRRNEIERPGFGSVVEFVANIAGSCEELFLKPDGRLALVKNARPMRFAIVANKGTPDDLSCAVITAYSAGSGGGGRKNRNRVWRR